MHQKAENLIITDARVIAAIPMNFQPQLVLIYGPQKMKGLVGQFILHDYNLMIVMKLLNVIFKHHTIL